MITTTQRRLNGDKTDYSLQPQPINRGRLRLGGVVIAKRRHMKSTIRNHIAMPGLVLPVSSLCSTAGRFQLQMIA